MKTYKHKYEELKENYEFLLKRINRLKIYQDLIGNNLDIEKIHLLLKDVEDGLNIINNIEKEYRINNTDSSNKSVIEIVSEQLLYSINNFKNEDNY